MLWLDWIIFGNGKGLGSPYFDDAFFWLSGNLYTWIGGYGAQLSSIEWKAPRAGVRRKLLGRDFVVLHYERRWIRVKIAWALAKEPKNYSEIAQLRHDLFSWGHGK